jgi:polyisoprenoid-binding protein YceI
MRSIHFPSNAAHRYARLFLTCVLALPAIALAAPQTWRFDPLHTQVWFSADHQGFSHPQGRLHIKEGWFHFDAKDWTSARVDVLIDLDAADMGDVKWSEAVKSASWLHVERWPTARFVSRSVEATDATHGVIHGDLTLCGKTRPVDVAFTLNRIGNDPYAFRRKAGFSASASLQRADFGMDRYKEVVGDTITLRFEIEAVADRDAARTQPGERHDGTQE